MHGSFGPYIIAGRKKVRDMQTFDSHQFMPITAAGDMRGKMLEGGPRKTHDGRVVDSTGAFLVGELERLDPELHLPLTSVSWSRDIPLRDDVTIGDDVSSFSNSSYASAGGLGTGNGIGNGKAWLGKITTQVTGIAVDIGVITHSLRPWAMELKYTVLELESAAKLGRPVDAQKWEGIQLKHQMDIDEMVFFGDTPMAEYGLLNSDNRSGADQVTTVQNLPNGAQGSPSWFKKTPDEILADFNTALTTVWQTSAWAVVPTDILLPTDRYGYIATAKVSQAGNVSILKYVEENNLLARAGRGKLNIREQKWCNGAGVGGTIGNTSTTNRMAVYTNEHDRVRYPMTMTQSTPLQYDSIWQKKTYFCRLGVVEIVYPETVGYFDGL